MEEEEWSLDI